MLNILFQANPNELRNGVINSAFMLIFKDLIRLFACYNDGIINLLGNPCYWLNILMSLVDSATVCATLLFVCMFADQNGEGNIMERKKMDRKMAE